MKSLSDVNSIQSDLSTRTMTLTLSLDEFDQITFRSCELLGKGFRNRISFAESKLVEDVLVARLANAIKSCLSSIPEGAQVLSLPDFLVEVPGLALSGVHVMIREAHAGVRNAILRFKDFMGAINQAFQIDVGLHEPYASHSERLAVNVLAEICLPILNLSHSIDAMSVTQNNRKMIDLADRLREFEFQTELLKRFIYNAGIGHAEAQGTYLYVETPQPQRRLTNQRYIGG
jgi:hypothetical protein